MLNYELEHVFSYYITVGLPEVIGPVPEGLRLNFYITGGKITGPKVFGRVRKVGADWVTIRLDGIGQIDVNAVFETEDGALIDVTNDGVADFGERGFERMVGGGRPQSPTRFRTTLRLRTAHPEYLWLNRLQCLGIGEADFERARVDYDVYAVR